MAINCLCGQVYVALCPMLTVTAKKYESDSMEFQLGLHPSRCREGERDHEGRILADGPPDVQKLLLLDSGSLVDDKHRVKRQLLLAFEHLLFVPLSSGFFSFFLATLSAMWSCRRGFPSTVWFDSDFADHIWVHGLQHTVQQCIHPKHRKGAGLLTYGALPFFLDFLLIAHSEIHLQIEASFMSALRPLGRNVDGSKGNGTLERNLLIPHLNIIILLLRCDALLWHTTSAADLFFQLFDLSLPHDADGQKALPDHLLIRELHLDFCSTVSTAEVSGDVQRQHRCERVHAWILIAPGLR
mmetsp:Transcript_62800/g.104462  ORF Transcript_62800/g.104462 Transcript_62800/m.104462 type:complete len:298 (+) Transcript_62800:88-981(+)